MSVKSRVIPTILLRGRSVVKGERFESWRSVGSALQAVRVHEARGVDEIILLDVEATPQGRGPNFALIEEMTRDCFTPLTVGGGVRTIDDIKGLLRAGADKVAVCTEAFRRPQFIHEAAEKFGCQCITIAIDVKAGSPVTHCGKEQAGLDPVTWAQLFQEYGAGEILLTDVDRDGTLEGYNLGLIGAVSSAVSIPVIASGGGADYGDFAAAFRAGAHAVAAGAIWQFTEATPRKAKEALAKEGYRVRL